MDKDSVVTYSEIAVIKLEGRKPVEVMAYIHQVSSIIVYLDFENYIMRLDLEVPNQ